MVTISAAPVEIAVPRCTPPSGTTPGSSADAAGLSKPPAIPSTAIATKICGTVIQPPSVPQVRNDATAHSAIWHTAITRRRS